MNLENIKEKLEKEGYSLIFRPLKDIEKCLQRFIPVDDENISLDEFFRIFVIDGKIYLDFSSQRRENRYFNNEKELIDHIKEVFPL